MLPILLLYIRCIFSALALYAYSRSSCIRRMDFTANLATAYELCSFVFIFRRLNGQSPSVAHMLFSYKIGYSPMSVLPDYRQSRG